MPRKSAWGARVPSASHRTMRLSRPATISRRPSGSQSKQNGRPKGVRTTTSVFPARSIARISCAPQSDNQSRPSCHRGDSPIASPQTSVFTFCRLCCDMTTLHHHRLYIRRFAFVLNELAVGAAPTNSLQRSLVEVENQRRQAAFWAHACRTANSFKTLSRDSDYDRSRGFAAKRCRGFDGERLGIRTSRRED